MNNTLNTKVLSLAAAIVAADVMLALGVLANLGIYEEAAAAMERWHIFFSLSVTGIIGGMIEAAIITFVITFAFGWTYNQLAGRLK